MGLMASVPSSKFADIFRAGHPSSTPTRLPRWGPRGWRRCSSLKYSRYSRSSRLASRAPRPENLSPNFELGTLESRLQSHGRHEEADRFRSGRRLEHVLHVERQPQFL